ncbi:MAG: hypothetical protein NT155_03100 [Candidatus Staskawiczbacteria bacterium]|nr:hypothetical protein [Candidatus Staskawiczbacteria bacterium]
MINTKQGAWLLAILGLIMVILLGILFFVPAKFPEEKSVTGVQGLTIFSLRPNQEISSPLKITGAVNGNGWAGFEGQVGTVALLDNSGKSIASAPLTATTDWMKFPASFEANLDFKSDVPQSGTLVFHNENPSDMRDKDRTFVLPVILQP